MPLVLQIIFWSVGILAAVIFGRLWYRRHVSRLYSRWNQQLDRQVEIRTQELLEARAELQRAERLTALNRMVVGVSHKLSTPLGNLLTTTTLLAGRMEELEKLTLRGVREGRLSRGMGTPGEASSLEGACDDTLEFLQKNLETLKTGIALQKVTILQTVELINRFKQVDVFRRKYTKSRFLVGRFLDDLEVFVRDRLGSELLELRWSADRDLGLSCFEEVLLQVLYDLVENCALHSYSGRAGGLVDLRLLVQNNGVVFQVEDYGRGITGTARERVFDPFYTTALNKGSGGLGLTICEVMVREILGGQLSLEDKQSPGCLFTVWIPDPGLYREVSAPEIRKAEEALCP